MADHPTSPFSGLDKALLRSTKPTPAPPEPSPTSHEQAVVELPRAASPPKPVASRPERSTARTGEHSNGRRIITRNSFEIYEDQMDILRELAYHEKREGKPGSMSAMVRTAIDRFIAETHSSTSEK